MAGPWNTDLNGALRFTEFTPQTTTCPTTTEATLIWEGSSAEIEAEFLGMGVTITASGKDFKLAQIIEAKYASACVQEAVEKQRSGRVSQDTERLKQEVRDSMDRIKANPYGIDQLGATVSRKRCNSFAKKYANTDKDTSIYRGPLQREDDYGLDEDL